MRLNQVTVPCTNVAESVAFYTKLGLIQIVASDHYARFVCPDGDTTLSVHVVDEVADGAAPVVYFECDDLDLTVRELESAGIVFDSQPEDQRWLWSEARLHDPAGNEVCLYHAGENRLIRRGGSSHQTRLNPDMQAGVSHDHTVTVSL